jgi:hypothetical protein
MAAWSHCIWLAVSLDMSGQNLEDASRKFLKVVTFPSVCIGLRDGERIWTARLLASDSA